MLLFPALRTKKDRRYKSIFRRWSGHHKYVYFWLVMAVALEGLAYLSYSVKSHTSFESANLVIGWVTWAIIVLAYIIYLFVKYM